MGALKSFFPTFIFALALLSSLARGEESQPAVVSGTWYEVLGVQGDVSLTELKRAFRKAARESHPEGSNPNLALYKDVITIWSHIEDPAIRALYDQMLRTLKVPAKPGDAVRQIELFELLKTQVKQQGKEYETATFQDLKDANAYLRSQEEQVRNWQQNSGNYAAAAAKAEAERKAQIQAWEEELQRRAAAAEAARLAAEAAEYERLANEKAEAFRAEAAAKENADTQKKAAAQKNEPHVRPRRASEASAGVCWKAVARLGVAASVAIVSSHSFLSDTAEAPSPSNESSVAADAALETNVPQIAISGKTAPLTETSAPIRKNPKKKILLPGHIEKSDTQKNIVVENMPAPQLSDSAKDAARSRGRRIKDLIKK